MASLARIGEDNFSELEAQSDMSPGPKVAAAGPAHFSFENVGFANRLGHPVLQDVSFTARPGTITAFVGASGAGKTTLANLLLRFADCDAGAILLDGRDVGEYTAESHIARITRAHRQ